MIINATVLNILYLLFVVLTHAPLESLQLVLIWCVLILFYCFIIFFHLKLVVLCHFYFCWNCCFYMLQTGLCYREFDCNCYNDTSRSLNDYSFIIFITFLSCYHVSLQHFRNIPHPNWNFTCCHQNVFFNVIFKGKITLIYFWVGTI